VNLFNKPGSIQRDTTKRGEFLPCSSINLDVLDKQTVDGIEFYKVRYKSQTRWQKRECS
jgi:hypothetical protein